MSQLKIKYDTSAIAIPGKILDVLDRATGTDLKVLLCLCGSQGLGTSYDEADWAERVAEAADCDADAVKSAVSFWRGAGLLILDEKKKTAPQAGKAAEDQDQRQRELFVKKPDEEVKAQAASENDQSSLVKLRARNELPNYTTEQLAALLEAHTDTANWIEECQRIFGKMFNTLEVNTVLGFVDYLGLDWEYVIVLISYYVVSREQRNMPKSIHGVEKMALSFYDKGIHTTAALQEEIKRLDHFNETEGQLRALFGMGERSMTPAEKKHFSTWLYEFGYGMDIIRLAYEKTVDNTGKASVKYMNSVLANWNRDGIRTPEDVKAADETHKSAVGVGAEGKKGRKTAPTGSFDTDDFFAAAVRRSFGDDTPKN